MVLFVDHYCRSALHLYPPTLISFTVYHNKYRFIDWPTDYTHPVCRNMRVDTCKSPPWLVFGTVLLLWHKIAHTTAYAWHVLSIRIDFIDPPIDCWDRGGPSTIRGLSLWYGCDVTILVVFDDVTVRSSRQWVYYQKVSYCNNVDRYPLNA